MGVEEKDAVAEVLDSGRLAQGPKVAEFEERFAKVAGTDHAVAVANGTVALALALRALELPSRSFVTTTPFTFIATATAVADAGHRPAFTDIDASTFNLDPRRLGGALDGSVSAILPVHLYGLPAPMDEIADLAGRRKLPVLEDAAQAVGARYKGRSVGSLGTAACFSLYATKNITTGEGGMITTDDPRLAERLRVLRNQGQRSRYQYERIGGNYRLTEMQAAIGIVQLRRLNGLNTKRQGNAKRLLSGLKGIAGLAMPSVPKGYVHVWHQFTIRVLDGRREELRTHLDREGIETGIYYPQGLHQIGIFAGARHGPLPNCERAAREVLSLPVHPGLTAKDCTRIVAAVREFCENRA